MRIDRGRWLALAVIPLAAACGRGDAQSGQTVPPAVAAAAVADTMVVYKTPTCGCCNDWVDHVRAHGFTVVTHDLDRLDDVKRELGVPAGMISCHTATIGGYTLEGHVPADLILRMLEENATFRGLTVPGMPMGSPGMEGPWKDRYDVLSFAADGSTDVYATR